MVILVVVAVLYFLPAVIALLRGHRNAGAITVLNLLLGWTLVGWVVALVWSFTSQERYVYVSDAQAIDGPSEAAGRGNTDKITLLMVLGLTVIGLLVFGVLQLGH